MKRISKKHNLKKMLFLMTSSLIFFSVTVISTVGAYRYRHYFIEQAANKTQELVEQLAINTSSYIDELSRLSLSPYYSQEIMDLLEDKSDSPADKLNKKREIEGYLREVMTIPRKEILRVYILSDDVYASTRTSHTTSPYNNYQSEEWYKNAMSSNKIVFLPVQKENEGGYTLSVFSLVRRLNSLSGSNDALGVIRVDANYSGISQVMDSVEISPDGALFIYDENGNVIYRNEKILNDISEDQLINTMLVSPGKGFINVGNNDFLLNSSPIIATDWYIGMITSKSYIKKETIPIWTFSIILAFVCAIIGLLLTALYVNLAIKPVEDTIKVMETARGGDLNVRAPSSSISEIDYLNSTFNTMLKEIGEMIEHDKLLTQKIYEAKYLQKKAQYDSLYQQIQPHFLFNTLSTISLLIKSNKHNDAVMAINELSILLRGMINTDREISLQSEINIAQSYLALQSRRHDDLTYSISEEKEINHILIPAMTIQPLIENAIIHGCEPKCAPTHIALLIKKESDYAMITVSDNGVGMTAELTEQLTCLMNGSSDAKEVSDSRSVGLSNISERLRLKFGNSLHFQIESEENKGTKVTMAIPLTNYNGGIYG